jgi:hypothetical protein
VARVSKCDFSVGDVFSFPLPTGESLCGQVLFDVSEQAIAPKVVGSSSPLMSLPSAMLVRVFRERDEGPPLVDGVFVRRGVLPLGAWRVEGRREFDVHSVAFPQTLIRAGVATHFRWGEVSIPLSVDDHFFDRNRVLLGVYPLTLLGDICMIAQGRADELGLPPRLIELRSLHRSDLRYSPKRSLVYRHISLSPDDTYYDTALAQGFDLRRFYEEG